jgi:hypothetical protein
MPAPTRQVVLFDNSPLEDAAWIQRAAQIAGVKLLLNDPIAEELGKDPQARKVLERRPIDGSPFPEIGPYFQKALEKTIEARKVDASKLALHSTMWLDYGTRAECAVIDLDPLYEQLELGKKSGVSAADLKKYEAFGTRAVDGAKKHLGENRMLVLPRKTTDAQKAELAAAHVKKFLK